MPQTSIDPVGIGFVGQNVEPFYPGYSRSFAAEGEVLAGQPVLRGTDPDSQCIAIANGDTVDATTLAGFVVKEKVREDSNVPDEKQARIMRKGVIYVTVTGAVVAGLSAFVGNATAQLGQITDGTGTGLVALPGSRFMTSAADGELAALEINL